MPGFLVDAIVIHPEQWQTVEGEYNPSFSGRLRTPLHRVEAMPLNERKIVARRAYQELFAGAVVNLGVGMADGVAAVAVEEGFGDQITLTVEQGVIGGMPAKGLIFGVSYNPTAFVDQPYQFDFYDGGGLDVSCLGCGEVDASGNVNVSKLGDKLIGTGGFVNISQNAKKLIFCSTFTAGGLQVEVADGELRILREGKHRQVSRIYRASDLQRAVRPAGRSRISSTSPSRLPRHAGWVAADRDRAGHRAGARHPAAHGLRAHHPRGRSETDGRAVVAARNCWATPAPPPRPESCGVRS